MTTPALFYRRTRDDAATPTYATSGSSGLDLAMVGWCFPDDVRPKLPEVFVKDLTIEPGQHYLIKTGLEVEIPMGYEGQVRPRSGLTLYRGLVAAFGTIDADYRGEIGITLYNHDDESHTVLLGTAVAQLVIAPVTRVDVIERPTLSETARGTGGYGSTSDGAIVRGIDGLVFKR